MRKLFFLILTFCLSTALAEDIKLVSGEYVPLTGPALPGGGPLATLVREVLLKAGYTATETGWLPWARGYQLTEQGRYDATFPYTRNPDRERAFLFSDEIFHSEVRFFVRADAAADIGEGWRHKVLCRPVGYDMSNIQPWVDKYQLGLERPFDLSTCFRLLQLGRVDLVPCPDLVVPSLLKSMDIPALQIKMLTTVISDTRFHLIVPRRRPQGAALIEAFNRTLTQFRRDGRYKAIVGDLGSAASN